jgi:hypothetical protein
VSLLLDVQGIQIGKGHTCDHAEALLAFWVQRPAGVALKMNYIAVADITFCIVLSQRSSAPTSASKLTKDRCAILEVLTLEEELLCRHRYSVAFEDRLLDGGDGIRRT